MEDAIKESGLKNVVVVGDKGFYSERNVQWLASRNILYILPLRRNSGLIDYTPTQVANKRGWDGYFIYQNRPIWYASKKEQVNGRVQRVILFMDNNLQKEKISDFLIRKEQGKRGYTMSRFWKRYKYFGTIAVITNLPDEKQAADVYHYWKSRHYIEQLYDTFKNTLKADITYLRNEHQLAGWMFVNFVALIFLYRLFHALKQTNLHAKYTPEDIITPFIGNSSIENR